MLRRVCIVLLLDKILCRFLVNTFRLCCHLILRFLGWLFCLNVLFIGDNWVLKFLTIIVLGSICAFKSNSVCSLKLSALTLDAYMFTIIFCWWFVSYISMEWNSLSFLTNSGLMSTLSDVSVATPACLGSPFAWKIFFF
jgi:hypothetical protein